MNGINLEFKNVRYSLFRTLKTGYKNFRNVKYEEGFYILQGFKLYTLSNIYVWKKLNPKCVY